MEDCQNASILWYIMYQSDIENSLFILFHYVFHVREFPIFCECNCLIKLPLFTEYMKNIIGEKKKIEQFSLSVMKTIRPLEVKAHLRHFTL